jgi:hypothetical protein
MTITRLTGRRWRSVTHVGQAATESLHSRNYYSDHLLGGNPIGRIVGGTAPAAAQYRRAPPEKPHRLKASARGL